MHAQIYLAMNGNCTCSKFFQRHMPRPCPPPAHTRNEMCFSVFHNHNLVQVHLTCGTKGGRASSLTRRARIPITISLRYKCISRPEPKQKLKPHPVLKNNKTKIKKLQMRQRAAAKTGCLISSTQFRNEPYELPAFPKETWQVNISISSFEECALHLLAGRRGGLAQAALQAWPAARSLFQVLVLDDDLLVLGDKRLLFAGCFPVFFTASSLIAPQFIPLRNQLFQVVLLLLDFHCKFENGILHLGNRTSRPPAKAAQQKENRGSAALPPAFAHPRPLQPIRLEVQLQSAGVCPEWYRADMQLKSLKAEYYSLRN